MKKFLFVALFVITLLSCTGCAARSNASVDSTDAVAGPERFPDVVGMTASDAVHAIKAAGYSRVETAPYHNQMLEEDTVAAQSKSPGNVYPADDLIVLQVASGLSSPEAASLKFTDPVLEARGFLAQGANADYAPILYENMKGIWISQYDLASVYYDAETGRQRTEDVFADLIDGIMQTVGEAGFNTVVLQVHPDCDSMYASEYYPWTDFLNGNSSRDAESAPDAVTSTGYGNTSLYDPLPIMIEAAHRNGLSFHAWINPMRGYSLKDVSYVNDRYLVKQWYNDPEKASTYVMQTQDTLYLNPACEPVRNLIAEMAAEICRYYDVDAVHMDDYFYPNDDPALDAAVFNAQTEFEDLMTFRRNNVNLLVQQIYSAVKAENQRVLFGISPAGEIEHNMSYLGSDVVTWCQEKGYVDYICPQIYFGFEHQSSAFDRLSQRWIDMKTEESTALYLGLTCHKIGAHDQYAGTGSEEWLENSDILKRSAKWIGAHSDEIDGFCLFSYAYIYDPITGVPMESTRSEMNSCLPVLQSLFSK